MESFITHWYSEVNQLLTRNFHTRQMTVHFGSYSNRHHFFNFLYFHFSQQAKFPHCTTSYRIGIRKVPKISRHHQRITKVQDMEKSNMKSKIFQILLQLPSYNKIIDRNEEDLFNLLVENLRLK